MKGYGPGGAAVLVNVATDNKNPHRERDPAQFSKNGGNMGEQGSVAWMFERKSMIVIDKEKAGEDQLMAIVLDAGARIFAMADSHWEVLSPVEAHEGVLEALQESRDPERVRAEIGMIP